MPQTRESVSTTLVCGSSPIRVVPVTCSPRPGSTNWGSEPGRKPPSALAARSMVGHHRVLVGPVGVGEGEGERRACGIGGCRDVIRERDLVLEPGLDDAEPAQVDDEPVVHIGRDVAVVERVPVDLAVPRPAGRDRDPHVRLGVVRRDVDRVVRVVVHVTPDPVGEAVVGAERVDEVLAQHDLAERDRLLGEVATQRGRADARGVEQLRRQVRVARHDVVLGLDP